MHTINFQLDKNLFTCFWSHNSIEQITHLNATHTNASNGNYRERARARARSRLSKVTMWTRKIRIDETEGIVCIHTHTGHTRDWENRELIVETRNEEKENNTISCVRTGAAAFNRHIQCDNTDDDWRRGCNGRCFCVNVFTAFDTDATFVLLCYWTNHKRVK